MNRIDTFQIQVERAEHACNTLDGYEKQWFVRLLDLLRVGQVARISYRECGYCEVVAIAYTNSNYSFFDIFSHRNLEIDYRILPHPIETELNGMFLSII